MEIAVIILALLAAAVFLGWLRAQRSAGLAREQADDLRREHTEALGKSEVALATARTTLEERERELSAKSEEHEQARASLRQAQTASETAAAELAKAKAELAKAKAELGERSAALGTVTTERNEARELHDQTRRELAATKAELAKVRADHEARQQEIDKAREELDKRFKGIAAEVAKASNEEFRKQAAAQFEQHAELANAELEKRVKPVGESLKRLDEQITSLEKARTGAYAKVNELIDQTQQRIQQLTDETGGLREIMRSSQLRGSWGESALTNVLELAGMRRNVDYWTQVSADDGTADFVVRMPGGRKIVIDSKVPFDQYRLALEAEEDAARNHHLAAHAATISRTAADLGKRNYSGTIDDALDFVVMWVPSDSIIEAATRVQSNIIEETFQRHRVLIATPVTMIALLNGVAAALKQEQFHENALEIQRHAQTLYDGVRRHAEHYARLGRALNSALTAYNSGVGSMQGNLLTSAREMRKLGGGTDGAEAPEPPELDTAPRSLSAPEYREDHEKSEIDL